MPIKLVGQGQSVGLDKGLGGAGEVGKAIVTAIGPEAGGAVSAMIANRLAARQGAFAGGADRGAAAPQVSELSQSKPVEKAAAAQPEQAGEGLIERAVDWVKEQVGLEETREQQQAREAAELDGKVMKHARETLRGALDGDVEEQDQ